MKFSRRLMTPAHIVPFAALLALSGTPAQAGDWLKLESQNTIVFSNTDETEARAYLNSLEAFNKLAHTYYRKLAPSEVSGDKYVSYYFKRLDDYESFNKAPDRQIILHTSCRDGYGALWTANAEINEQFGQLYQFVGLNNTISGFYDMREMPNWMGVGLHAFLASAEVKDSVITVGQPARGQYEVFNPRNAGFLSLTTKNDRLPFADILSGKYSKPEKAIMAPAQSWVIMHYLLTSSPENAGKLYQFADDYNFGMDAQAAWKKDIGLDPTFFDTVVSNYKTNGVPALTYKITDVGAVVKVTPIAKSDADVPLLSASAQTCPAEKDATRILQQLARAVDKAPSDAYTARENARAQILLGQPENALAYVTTGLTAQPDDADLNYLAGRIYLARAEGGQDKAANFAQARSYLGKSYKLKGTYAPTLYYYARAFADQPNYPSDNTLASAEAADALMNTIDYSLYLAELYARRGMFDDVVTVVVRHRTTAGGTNYDVAADKIEQAAKARKTSDVLAVLAALPYRDRFAKAK